ncbi:uncharacterized protein LOC105208465 isoform X1 [Zeugodacus cucurbitae]|uniref:uncharacterized protein LOC105208465 isoform X1 n=1 Tax=Zeugodacus cucurbitae TaxID=28588 RepID=UPI0023D8E640|nr:uncharacterized protein LOC105208465 isoform X1 [Zeugodacus cucurbitae]
MWCINTAADIDYSMFPHNQYKVLIVLKNMNISNWLILFGVLTTIPGSTLNVMERVAVTSTKAVTDMTIPLVLKTVVSATMQINTEADNLKTYRTNKESSMQTSFDSLNLEKSTIVPTLPNQLSWDIILKTKNQHAKEKYSIQDVQGNLNKTSEDAELSTMRSIKTTTASAKAKLLRENSTQSITKVEVVTKRTKGVLNVTGITSMSVGRKYSEGTTKTGVSVPSARSSTIITPQQEIQLFSITGTNQKYAHQNQQNMTSGQYPSREHDIDNIKCNYHYDYNKKYLMKKDDHNNGIVDERDSRHICSNNQRHTTLYVRSEAQRENRHRNDYDLNNSNMPMKQQKQSMRKLRQQRTRQVRQQQFNLTTIAPIRVQEVMPQTENYEHLIDKDTNIRRFTTFSNQIVHSKTNASRSSNALLTLLTTTYMPYPDTTMEVGKTAVGQKVVNITTIESSIPTVSLKTMKSTTKRPLHTTTQLPTPLIDDYRSVISQAGTHAYLPCNVKQIVKNPISWLRVRDGHILTVDQTTFISDQRFQPIFTPNPERWSLQIKYVQLKDEGTYECQVSTEPKSSAIVSLRVVEPKTELIGESTQHVTTGSEVKLRCIITQALDPPVFINWFHNQKQIYLHSRRGWRTEIERVELPISDFSTTSDITTSTKSTPTITTTATMNNVESTTTINPPTGSATVSSANATTTVDDTSIDFGTAGKNTPVVHATTRDGESATNLPLSRLGTDVVDDLLDNHDRFEFGTGNFGNATFSQLPTTAAAVVTISTPVPTKVSTTHCPPTTLTITTTSTLLAAVEVRQVTTASLIIPSVKKKDSGNYTCSPSNSAPKTVVLHVLNGEYSASAITSGESGNINISMQCKWRLILLYLMLSHWHHEFAEISIQLRFP